MRTRDLVYGIYLFYEIFKMFLNFCGGISLITANYGFQSIDGWRHKSVTLDYSKAKSLKTLNHKSVNASIFERSIWWIVFLIQSLLTEIPESIGFLLSLSWIRRVIGWVKISPNNANHYHNSCFLPLIWRVIKTFKQGARTKSCALIEI